MHRARKLSRQLQTENLCSALECSPISNTWPRGYDTASVTRQCYMVLRAHACLQVGRRLLLMKQKISLGKTRAGFACRKRRALAYEQSRSVLEPNNYLCKVRFRRRSSHTSATCRSSHYRRAPVSFTLFAPSRSVTLRRHQRQKYRWRGRDLEFSRFKRDAGQCRPALQIPAIHSEPLAQYVYAATAAPIAS